MGSIEGESRKLLGKSRDGIHERRWRGRSGYGGGMVWKGGVVGEYSAVHG